MISASTCNRIAPDVIEAVRLASRLEDIVGEYTTLRRVGPELLGICVFHDERTPSLSVNPEKQLFHCHGCLKGGDVFRFTQTVHSVNFPRAVQMLAEKAGIAIQGFQASPELVMKVQGDAKTRNEEKSFKEFCDNRQREIASECRARSRAASHAEAVLKSGIVLSDAEHDAAWEALKRFFDLHANLERRGLCDPQVLRKEWSSLHV